MATRETEAREYLARAINSEESFCFPWSRQEKHRKAASLYRKAAHAFKEVALWEDAAEAFLKAGALCNKSSVSRYGEELNVQLSAGECYKNNNNPLFIQCFERGVEVLTHRGDFGQAGRLERRIAEWIRDQLEKDPRTYGPVDTIRHYELAAHYFRCCVPPLDHSESEMRLAVAELTALSGRYDAAAKLFQELAAFVHSSGVLRFRALEHMVRAALCFAAAGDVVGCENVVRKLGESPFDATQSKEARFLGVLVRAFDQGHSGAQRLEEIFAEQGQNLRFDGWHTKLKLVILEYLTEGGAGVL